MPARGADRAVGTGLLVAIAWVASVVAANGLLSLLLNVEVIPEAGAGPLVGPLAVLAAFLVLIALLSRRVPPRPSLLLPLECLLLVPLTLVLIGTIGYGMARGTPAAALIFASRSITSIFTLAAALLAGAAGLVFVVLVGAARAGAQRPRWPWEREE